MDCFGGDFVGVEGFEEGAGDFAEGFAAGVWEDFGGDFGGGELAFEAGEARGERAEGVVVAFAEGDGEEDVFEGDGGLFVEGLGFGFVGFADADGIDDDEVGFGAGVGTGDGLEFGGGEDAGATAFHLLKVAEALDVAEEDEAFEGFDVGAGGDHVHGDGDAERG